MFIKVAQVLAVTHQYDEAIKYYNKSGILSKLNAKLKDLEFNY